MSAGFLKMMHRFSSVSGCLFFSCIVSGAVDKEIGRKLLNRNG